MENALLNNTNPVNLILKLAGKSCNLNCTYCFETKKAVNTGFLSISTLEKCFETFEQIGSITFHGGEPLLYGIDKMRSLLTFLSTKRDFFTSLKIQTNATLISPQWCDLFFEEFSDLKIKIAVSLDGDEICNNFRVKHSGDESFFDVMKGIDLLNHYNVKYGVLSVINLNTLDRYREYADFIFSLKNMLFLKLNPLFNIKDNYLDDSSITPSQYAQFIINIFEIYLKQNKFKEFAFEPVLSILQFMRGKDSRYCNYKDKKCFDFLSIYPDGVISACDCFSPTDSYLGNLNESFDFCKNKENLSEGFVKILEKCNTCSIQSFCRGGCLSQRFYFQNSNLLSSDFCHAKHILYKYFLRFKK